jgi:hypothetical protein
MHADKSLIFAIPEMTICYNNNVSKDRKLQLRYLQQFSVDWISPLLRATCVMYY